MGRVEAAAYIGISCTKFDELRKSGRISRPRLIDGRKLWDVLELDGEEAVADLRNLLLEKLKQPAFGLWKGRGIDAREYVDAIRSEWDRE